MTKLTREERNALPDSDFALPGRHYPIEDPSHGRDALSRVSANGTPEQKAKVRAQVRAKFPGIGGKVKKQKAKPDAFYGE